MKVPRIVPAFLLFFMLGSQLVSPARVEAWCCQCNSCMWSMGCTCAGYWDEEWRMTCGYCRSQDQDDLKVSDPSMGQRVPNSRLVTKSEVMQRVGELMQGRKCFREKIALSVLGHAGEDLRYKPVHFTSLSS